MPNIHTDLASAAIYITCIIGPIHVISTIGCFLGRNTPAFAARAPRPAIGANVAKTLSFFCISWLFLDPNCPCIIAIVMWWLDWIANGWYVFQKVILLWRCEIQAALDHKSSLSIDKNLFVRFRQMLLPRTQLYIMIAIFVYCASYNIVLLGVYPDLAMRPCITDNIKDNNLVLIEIIMCWVAFLPLMFFSSWCMQRLKKFPDDNWKVYRESRLETPYTFICAVVCLVVLAAVPTVDGIIFVHFTLPWLGSVFHFLMPLHLHRQTREQLANLDMDSLASFDKLLQNEPFLQAFSNFLKKEFSSENLFFWREVQSLKQKYGALLPDAQRPSQYDHTPGDDEEYATWLNTAATKFIYLGSQFVGPTAPWQINISGFTAQDLEKDLQKTREACEGKNLEELQESLEVSLVTLVTVQHEVYELLRKDPYPRFLLTPSAMSLNKDGNFKRLLASEKLEDEANKHSNKQSKTGEEKSNNSSNNSKDSERKSEKKSTRSKDAKSRTRGSESEAEMSPAKQKQTTLQVRSSMSPQRTGKRGGDGLLRGSQGEKASTSEKQPPDAAADDRPSFQQPSPYPETRSLSCAESPSPHHRQSLDPRNSLNDKRPSQQFPQADSIDPSPRPSEVLERTVSEENV